VPEAYLGAKLLASLGRGGLAGVPEVAVRAGPAASWGHRPMGR